MPTLLPIHFFTIVLNGEPFIRYHIGVFSKLKLPWHWHIVEGVAELKHDTAWSQATGGRIPAEFHRAGRSIDGTSEYLDQLSQQLPLNVTLYRKDPDLFWGGKREMVNAPLANLPAECLLWELDCDEFWTESQIIALHELFMAHPEKTAAYFHCYYFIGPRRFVASLNTWATGPKDWLRAWRFQKGMRWQAHEPPVLVNSAGQNVAELSSFTRDETLRRNITFQHFAYVTEAQVRFKEAYYGYKDAVRHWRRLQQSALPTDPAKYLPWAKKARVQEWSDDQGELLLERVLTPVQLEASPSPQQNPMMVATESQFNQTIRKLFRQIRPKRIIETGTFFGTGTTAIIASALRDNTLDDAVFYTIEVNPEHHRQALRNLERQGFICRSWWRRLFRGPKADRVHPLLGLSVPRETLPTLAQIEEQCVRRVEFKEIFIDHGELERARLYYQETNFDVPDDLLDQCLRTFDYSPDFVLLDSAGYMGNLEFQYVIKLLQGPCYLALDDLFHIKHYKSYLQMQQDERFEILDVSREKFGFCIAKFTPATRAGEAPRSERATQQSS